MYTEQLRMSPKSTALPALSFALPVMALLGVIALVSMPVAGKIAGGGGAFLDAVLGACLLATRSRIRIRADSEALAVAFRILFRPKLRQ